MSDKCLVLVVEDDADIRNLIRINLRAAGFSVLTAETGEEGLELASEHQPLVMTLDRMLPGISGTEVCSQLRADPRTADIYVLMVTALGENSDRIEGFEVGADDYVPKPFQFFTIQINDRSPPIRKTKMQFNRTTKTTRLA